MLPFSGPIFPRTAPVFSQKGQVQLYNCLWPVFIPTHVDLSVPDIYSTNVYHFLQQFFPQPSPPILGLSQRTYPHLLSQKREINLWLHHLATSDWANGRYLPKEFLIESHLWESTECLSCKIILSPEPSKSHGNPNPHQAHVMGEVLQRLSLQRKRNEAVMPRRWESAGQSMRSCRPFSSTHDVRLLPNTMKQIPLYSSWVGFCFLPPSHPWLRHLSTQLLDHPTTHVFILFFYRNLFARFYWYSHTAHTEPYFPLEQMLPGPVPKGTSGNPMT